MCLATISNSRGKPNLLHPKAYLPRGLCSISSCLHSLRFLHSTCSLGTLNSIYKCSNLQRRTTVKECTQELMAQGRSQLHLRPQMCHITPHTYSMIRSNCVCCHCQGAHKTRCQCRTSTASSRYLAEGNTPWRPRPQLSIRYSSQCTSWYLKLTKALHTGAIQ